MKNKTAPKTENTFNTPESAYQVTEEMVNKAVSMVKELEEMMKILTAEQNKPRSHSGSFGPKSYDFVSSSLAYGQNDPRTVPGYINIDHFAEDWKTFLRLSEIRRVHGQFLERIEESRQVLGNRCFDNARKIYSTVKDAKEHNVRGMDIIHADLRKRFKHKSSTTSTGNDTNVTNIIADNVTVTPTNEEQTISPNLNEVSQN